MYSIISGTMEILSWNQCGLTTEVAYRRGSTVYLYMYLGDRGYLLDTLVLRFVYDSGIL